MANLFVAGYTLAAAAKLQGNGGFTILNITGWDWAEKVVKLVTTHTGSLGIEWWLAGVLKGDSRVQANFDVLNMPHLAVPFIQAGAGGLIQFAVGSTNPFQIPMRIETVHYQSAVEDLMKYDFTCSLDGSQGSYVRPS